MTDNPDPLNKADLSPMQISQESEGRKVPDGEKNICSLLDQEQAGVIVVDCEDYTIVDANLTAQRLMRAEPDQIIGQSCTKFFDHNSAGFQQCPLQDPKIKNRYFSCRLLPLGEKPVDVLKVTNQVQINGKKYIIESFFNTADRNRVEQYLLEQRNLAEALRDTAKVINQSLNLKEVLYHILNMIGKVVPHDSANVMLLEGNIARMTAWRGYENLKGVQFSEQPRCIDDLPNLRRMVDTGLPIVVPDTRASSNWVNLNSSTWICSYVSAPICRSGKTIGFLNLNSRIPQFYTPAHAERLMAFADQAAIAIENARLYERAQQELDERKRAEEALQEIKNQLEELVAQRTIELRRANEQLREELVRRKQAEQNLEEERAFLALRVEERTAELSAANMELAKAAEMKDAFLASMSHELRTPLTAILNLSETLLEEVYGPVTEAQIKSLNTIRQSGEHLLVLINNILDLSKIDAGQLELMMDEVDVGLLCQSSLDFVREMARKKNMIVSVTIDPEIKFIWADPRRMKQILTNLLSNAVKFTPAGGAIGLAVTGNREKKQVNFTVWDNGIGIPGEKMKMLFKPFIQLDSRLARNYDGTGLGLALVYKLVELHNGGIALESEVGLGSRFTVSLKWQEEPEITNALPAENAKEEVTVPADLGLETDVTMHFRRCLDELNLEAVGYWYEKEAVMKAIETGYDLFVMDVRLLSKGVELLSLLVKAVEKARIPILILTQGKTTTERPSLPMATSYLDYPFNAQEVRQKIRLVSPQGTASLVRKVAVFVERKIDTAEKQRSILLAEDNPVSVRVYSDYLTAMGYQVSVAPNGTEAIERAREKKPDLILMDVQMPGMDGIEATRRIRRDAKLMDIPIIAITALMLPGERQRCLDAGASEFLCKPLTMAALEKVIRRHIARQGK